MAGGHRDLGDQEAARTGDVSALLGVLAPDVVMVGDGGGVAAALPRPVEGAEKVAAALTAFARVAAGFNTTTMQINGGPALLLDIPGDAPTVIAATVAGGRITRLYAMRNPHKLGRIASAITLSR